MKDRMRQIGGHAGFGPSYERRQYRRCIGTERLLLRPKLQSRMRSGMTGWHCTVTME